MILEQRGVAEPCSIYYAPTPIENEQLLASACQGTRMYAAGLLILLAQSSSGAPRDNTEILQPRAVEPLGHDDASGVAPKELWIV
jgi:hypothetical protein